MKPLSVDAIARAWQHHGNAEEAAKALGISRRTLFYRLARASKAELKSAFEQLLREQHWAVQRLQERIGRLEQVEREYTALERWNGELAAKNRQLHEMLAQALDAHISAIVDGTPAVMDQDCYAILGVTQTAPLEVIEATYRALARIHYPDRGGSNTAMQRINQAYDQVRRRHGRLH